jgi:hypothetical protein
MTALMRSSNCPRYFVPATISAMSSVITRLSRMQLGHVRRWRSPGPGPPRRPSCRRPPRPAAPGCSCCAGTGSESPARSRPRPITGSSTPFAPAPSDPARTWTAPGSCSSRVSSLWVRRSAPPAQSFSPAEYFHARLQLRRRPPLAFTKQSQQTDALRFRRGQLQNLLAAWSHVHCPKFWIRLLQHRIFNLASGPRPRSDAPAPEPPPLHLRAKCPSRMCSVPT